MVEPKNGVELVSATREDALAVRLFDKVWERCRGRCGNCGHDDPSHLQVVLAVPEEAGGKRVPSNATLLCRACEMAAEAYDRNPAKSRQDGRPINFWVSRGLFEALPDGQASSKTRNGFKSKGSLVRYLMTKFIRQPNQFEDLHKYQDDRGDDRVKISTWVDPDRYATFQVLVAERGSTVTETLIALIMLYVTEAEPHVERGRRL